MYSGLTDGLLSMCSLRKESEMVWILLSGVENMCTVDIAPVLRSILRLGTLKRGKTTTSKPS